MAANSEQDDTTSGSFLQVTMKPRKFEPHRNATGQLSNQSPVNKLASFHEQQQKQMSSQTCLDHSNLLAEQLGE